MPLSLTHIHTHLLYIIWWKFKPPLKWESNRQKDIYCTFGEMNSKMKWKVMSFSRSFLSLTHCFFFVSFFLPIFMFFISAQHYDIEGNLMTYRKMLQTLITQSIKIKQKGDLAFPWNFKKKKCSLSRYIS
jgi:hypothetical protein